MLVFLFFLFGERLTLEGLELRVTPGMAIRSYVTGSYVKRSDFEQWLEHCCKLPMSLVCDTKSQTTGVLLELYVIEKQCLGEILWAPLHEKWKINWVYVAYCWILGTLIHEIIWFNEINWHWSRLQEKWSTHRILRKKFLFPFFLLNANEGFPARRYTRGGNMRMLRHIYFLQIHIFK